MVDSQNTTVDRAFGTSAAVAHALVVDLFKKDGVPPVDLKGLDGAQKTHLLLSCCATLIVETIWLISGHDHDKALHGISSLTKDLKNGIRNKNPRSLQ